MLSADAGHLTETRDAVRSKIRAVDRLIVGNWSDANFLSNEVFDTVVAEYLLGAIEGYAPYFQYQLFARLRPHVGRTLYVIGVDPYLTGRCDSAAGEIVQSVGRFRDACAVLAGVNHYREYPAEWVMDRLQQVGLRILFSRRFPSTYDLGWIDRQLADSLATHKSASGKSTHWSVIGASGDSTPASCRDCRAKRTSCTRPALSDRGRANLAGLAGAAFHFRIRLPRNLLRCAAFFGARRLRPLRRGHRTLPNIKYDSCELRWRGIV